MTGASEPVQDTLAPYAALDEHSRGRRFAEPKPQFRTEYQRDRDRIIHSNAFRRLVYKTQVFVNHRGICTAPASPTPSRWLRSAVPWPAPCA
ncbi:deoxyguanosinetriphosphate triphosphohydrolase-like protein [mine drainage metagenome]|uniref:Deoxyguanosinetriphosphate triphosphohydrolase-like protein n=1 Tax=mine drainage metagenome TaxID=410659 RepID=T0Z1J9_9ZZZZ